METFTSGFLASIAANGLTTFVSYLGRQSARFIKEKRSIVESIARDAKLSTILQKATTDVARSLAGTPAGSSAKLKAFAASADVDAIVRQLYATRLTAQAASLATLRDEFRACFMLHLQEPPTADTGNKSIDVLFDALVSGCDRALEVAIEKGLLSAHDAKSAARTNLILDELASMKRMIDFISRSKDLNVAEIEDFHNRLRSQIEAKHSYIVPPHFDARRRVPLDDLYVTPAFTLQPRKGANRQEPQEVELEHILSTLYRAVILGNPGSGKSTLAGKICHDLAADGKRLRLAGRRVTPIMVTLRDYGRERRDRGLSIIQFIELTCNSTYQLAPPERAVEYLLRSGRILVVFDGLDELIDTSHRQKVSEDVESFGRLYPGTPILITSREVGYEQAPMDNALFDTLRIAPFGEKQVNDYVTKWFAADTELTEAQRVEKVQAFLRESGTVPDLRTNPLMLALMCNIYRGENYIPRNRPDVYEKCAVMLFEKWDKSRGINVPLPFEAHVRPAMMYLAHWVFSDEHLQGGVSERSLITKCTEYLCPRRYEDSDQAARAATEFIDFCRGRAWVFTDTGTTKEGERLYQFTHRTFLEYFTAAHLVRTHATPAMLSSTLMPRIAAREWDVVAQLAFQLQNKHVEGAGDALLTSLLQAATETRSTGKRSRLLSFGARTLEFLVPSPSVTRDIVTTCVNECIDAAMVKKIPRRLKDDDLSSELIGPLLAAAEENRSPVARQLSSLLAEGIEDKSTKRAQCVLQIGMNLSSFLYRPRASQYVEIDPQLHEFWEKMAVDILQKNIPKVECLCRDDFMTCLNAIYIHLVTPRQMAQWHGVASLFHGGDIEVSGFIVKPPLIPYVVLRIFEMLDDKEQRAGRIVSQWIPRLIEVASILIENTPPWLRVESAEEIKRWLDMSLRHSRGGGGITKADTPPHFAFLFLASCALVAEVIDPDGPDIDNSAAGRSPPYGLALSLRASRAEFKPTSDLASLLDRVVLTNEERKLLLAWIAGEVTLSTGSKGTIKS